MNEEGKGKNKYTFKVAFISVICTLLFIIILLLFVLFGLKKCSSRSSSASSIGNSSSMKYNYDNEKLDNTFKKIVEKQLLVDGFDDTLTDVIAVVYLDYNTSFDLGIVVRSASTLYRYDIDGHYYSGYDNFVEYLLSLDLDADLPLNGGYVSLETYIPTSERLTLDKECQYLVSTNDVGTVKYFSGFYYENNDFYIYYLHELIDNHFDDGIAQLLGSESPLYGYYQSLQF